jgi:DNA-binding NarL/FixJ family response regulator
VRVIVAEDVLLTREGIVHVLEQSGIEVVAQVEDASNLLALVATHHPDAVVMDIRMPPTRTDEGLVAANDVRAAFPDVAVVVLSQYLEPEYAIRLLEGQVDRVAYLLKERVFHPSVLVDALRQVTSGETVVDSTIVAHVMGKKRTSDALADLSSREREVLMLAAEGLSNKAIAERLFLSERTVESHMAQILGKLGIEESVDQHRRVLAVLTVLRD